MKITLESEYITASIECPGSDLNVTQVIEKLVRPVMMAHTYHPDSISKVIGEVNDYE